MARPPERDTTDHHLTGPEESEEEETELFSVRKPNRSLRYNPRFESPKRTVRGRVKASYGATIQPKTEAVQHEMADQIHQLIDKSVGE